MRIDPVLAATIAAVVDEGSLDAAAVRLNVTPSAVSQRVRALEQQLGRVLIVRTKPARATDAGATVVRLARQIALVEHEALAEFGLADDADDDGAADAGSDGQGSAGAGRTARVHRRIRVPLAVNADSLATWFLRPLARLGSTLDVDFDIHRDDQDFTARLLETGTVMAAVTSQERPVPGCTALRLGALPYRAVAAPRYIEQWLPDGVTPEALRTAPVVDFDRRDDLQRSWLRRQGVDPREVPRHFVPASSDFAEAVTLGLGWGMLAPFQSADALAAGALVPLGGPTITVALFWQQWNLRSTLLDRISAEVAAEAARVLEP